MLLTSFMLSTYRIVLVSSIFELAEGLIDEESLSGRREGTGIGSMAGSARGWRGVVQAWQLGSLAKVN